MISLSDRIDSQFKAKAGKKPFIVVDGQPTSYDAFTDRLRRLFAFFKSNGLVAGNRIAVMSTSVTDVATLMLGAIRSGIAVVNLNPDMSERDCSIALNACKLSRVFIDRTILERVKLPDGLTYTVIEAPEKVQRGFLGFTKSKSSATKGFEAELVAQTPIDAGAAPDPSATAMMLFTSGTTSAPKVVELSHGNLSSQVAAFFQVFDYDTSSRILNPLPLHFTDGMLHGPIVTFVSGATLYRPKRFDFQKFEELIHSIYRDRISHLVVVPAILSMLDRLGDSFTDVFESKDFRYIRCSGDLLPEPLWRNVQKRFNVKVANTYGMSETVCEALYAGPSDSTLRVGTVGKPVGCEIKIVAEDGKTLPQGETGELMVRGGIIMKGYLDQPELTAAAISDGWLKTGDLATVDAEGFVRIQGRRKQLIITGGANVHPQDITDCLLIHPAVAEAVTFGVPHAIWGEQIAAAVLLRDGKTATPQELITHCSKNISPHKVPRMVTIVPELPRNPSGKVLIGELKALVARLDNSDGSSADMETEDQVKSLAAKVFSCSVADLRLTSEPGNTRGWDSFSHLNLISAIEQRFGISLSSTDILRIRNLGDMVTLVKNSSPA